MWRLKFLLMPIAALFELAALAAGWALAFAGATSKAQDLVDWVTAAMPEPVWYTRKCSSGARKG